ncbi:FAD-dependent oxidoreductase [Streptomyces sp. NPDC004528]|uniref:dihydrolipoyl dehydrogenase family protein n=1 Tax=Streptomyces sp. NPDC004528 TaxID=3154550 RepID=UPI0033BC710A
MNQVEEAVEDVDLLVVGGGKGGKTLAMDLARAGRDVAMVERGMIGGTCINVACIPTKSLVTSARLLDRLARAEELGVAGVKGRVDLDLLRAHKSGVVEGMVELNYRQFIDSGMDFVLGTARFVAERTVVVELADGGRRVLRGADVVIDTGTVPQIPPVPGLAAVDPLTSESILRLPRIPERLVVLGGGYVGLEFAQMFTSFGSEVTVVDRAPGLLPGEDPDIAEALVEILREDGVALRTGAVVESAGRRGQDVVVRLEGGEEVSGSDVLLAVGREPVTAGLDLDRAGVAVDARGFVDVDDRLATTAPHTWALGDVAGSPQFTHASLDDYRVVKENLAGGDRRTTGRLVPWTLFTDPELARVGLTERQAREAGHDIRVARMPVVAVPRARTLRETRGVWKAVVERGSGHILGAALLGPESSEVVATVQTAMLAGLPHQALRDMILTHPTMAEGLNLLFTKWTDTT